VAPIDPVHTQEDLDFRAHFGIPVVPDTPATLTGRRRAADNIGPTPTGIPNPTSGATTPGISPANQADTTVQDIGSGVTGNGATPLSTPNTVGRGATAAYRTAADDDTPPPGAGAPPAAPPDQGAPPPTENQPAEDALLDTASQAVSQMIQQETQEYQQILDPLNQALQAIEYAQQVEQQEHPLDVTPQQGTVDVGPAAAGPMAQQQPPPQQQMAASLRQHAFRLAKVYDMPEPVYQLLLASMGRKQYQRLADVVSTLPDSHRYAVAQSMFDLLKADNPRLNAEPWFQATGASRPPFVRLEGAGGGGVHIAKGREPTWQPAPSLDTFEFSQQTPGKPTDNTDVKLPEIKMKTSDRGVQQLWQQHTKQLADQGLNRGGPPDIEGFAQAYPDLGERAINKLKKTVSNQHEASFFTRRVPGWQWDDHLNGYLSTAARDFACSCGEMIPTPSYQNCRCGKVWNSYPIGAGGDEHTASVDMFICREIPVRGNMIVANNRMACGPDEWVEDEDREDADAPHAPGKNANLQMALPRINEPLPDHGIPFNASYRLADDGFDITTDPGIQNDVRANYPGLMQPSAVPGTVGIPTDQQKALVGQPSTGFPSKMGAIGDDDHTVEYKNGERFCSKCGAWLWDPNVHHCPAKQAFKSKDEALEQDATTPPKGGKERPTTVTDKQRKKIEKGEHTGPEDVDMDKVSEKEEGEQFPPGGKKKKSTFLKGAPFADYADFADCVSKNKDKGDPDAYCGYIKHKVEDKKSSRLACKVCHSKPDSEKCSECRARERESSLRLAALENRLSSSDLTAAFIKLDEEPLEESDWRTFRPDDIPQERRRPPSTQMGPYADDWADRDFGTGRWQAGPFSQRPIVNRG